MSIAVVAVVPRGQDPAGAAPADAITAYDPPVPQPAVTSAPGPRAATRDSLSDSVDGASPLLASTSRRREVSEARSMPAPGPRRPTAPALPEVGSGEFLVAAGSTDVAGNGVLVTYQVEVEREVPLGRQGIAETVDRALLDPRGWTASGAHALARVESGGDLRVLLATPETTDALCAPLDTGGRLSCRNGDLVVLNAWRWLNGAESYAGDLRNYRRYLVNHEMGHALGNAHVECPAPGAAAPVMMQQTKGVGECVANPWPAPGSAPG